MVEVSLILSGVGPRPSLVPAPETIQSLSVLEILRLFRFPIRPSVVLPGGAQFSNLLLRRPLQTGLQPVSSHLPWEAWTQSPFCIPPRHRAHTHGA